MLVARLALNELWISYRLLAVVAAILLAALPAALVPNSFAPNLQGAPPGPLGWYAIALAAALVVVAATAAASVAGERGHGMAGWMAVRAVPRQTILLAWYAVFLLLLLAGLLPAGIVGWLSLQDALPPSGPGPFVAAMAGACSAGAAALAVAVLAGAILRPVAAAVATGVLTAPPLVGAATEQFGPAALPGGGLSVLADLGIAGRPIADALAAAGVALSIAALALYLATVAFERAEL